MEAAERIAGEGYSKVSEVCCVPSVLFSAGGLSQAVADGLSLCWSTGTLDVNVRTEEIKGRLGAASHLRPAHLHLLGCRVRAWGRGGVIALLSLCKSQEGKVQYHLLYG